MGLDEWIEIRVKDKDLRALNVLNDGEEEYTEYMYWRKDNLILEFFARKHPDLDNCIRVELSEDDIKELIELLKNPNDFLEEEDRQREKDYYKEDIEKLTKLLEMFEEYDVFFYAWW